MTAMLDWVPVTRIHSEATQVRRSVHPGRVLATALTAVLYMIGWAPSKLVKGLWMMLLWVLAAVKLGAVDAWVGRPAEDSD